MPLPSLYSLPFSRFLRNKKSHFQAYFAGLANNSEIFFISLFFRGDRTVAVVAVVVAAFLPFCFAWLIWQHAHRHTALCKHPLVSRERASESEPQRAEPAAFQLSLLLAHIQSQTDTHTHRHTQGNPEERERT